VGRSDLVVVLTGLITVVTLAPSVPAGASAGHAREHCGRAQKIVTPGAAYQVVSCLDDLTTAGTTVSGHTDPAQWAGLNAAGTVDPTGVPGIQVDGYFPDTSTTNTTTAGTTTPSSSSGSLITGTAGW
jgi:hypothetical protein